jgi:hypothetical protein
MSTQLEQDKAIATQVRLEHERLKVYILGQVPTLALGTTRGRTAMPTELLMDIARYEILEGIMQGPGGASG